MPISYVIISFTLQIKSNAFLTGRIILTPFFSNYNRIRTYFFKSPKYSISIFTPVTFVTSSCNFI